MLYNYLPKAFCHIFINKTIQFFIGSYFFTHTLHTFYKYTQIVLILKRNIHY